MFLRFSSANHVADAAGLVIARESYLWLNSCTRSDYFSQNLNHVFDISFLCTHSSSPGEVSTPAVEEKKEPTAAELKADKVAAKAAAKAARERQQAAVEAAAKN